MSAFRGEHANRSHAIEVELPLPEAFRLFEPEGERAWAPGWDPRYVHPWGGQPGRGMVFCTGAGDEETIWLVSRYEPADGLVEYVRLTPRSRIATVLVHCTSVGAASTQVTVTYAYTGLGPSGNAYVRDMTAERFAAFIDGWAEAISRSTNRAASPRD